MNDRMIWVVRLIGIIVFLVLMYLLMSLHARLVKMNEETPKAAMLRDCELRIADCEAAERVGFDCLEIPRLPRSAGSLG